MPKKGSGEGIRDEENNDSLIQEKGGKTQKKEEKRTIHIAQEAEDKEGSAKKYR